MVITCAGIDPVCTEQVNKIYVYFFKALSLSGLYVGQGEGPVSGALLFLFFFFPNSSSSGVCCAQEKGSN